MRKAALAVADAGFRVTLVWGDHLASTVVEGELGPVRTIGLPVPYLLRDARARQIIRRRAWRPGWPAYRDRGSLRAAVVRLQAASARAEGRGIGARLVLRFRAFVNGVRSKAFAFQERVFASLWRRLDRRRLGNLPHVNWRRELANVADLEAAFTKWLWRLEPDAIHVHDIHLLGAGVQAKRRLAKRGRRVPLVYDAHEYVSGLAGKDPVAEAAYAAMEAELIGDADAVITVSEPIADALVTRYGLPRRPTVVLNSPSAEGRAVCATDVRSAAGVASSDPLVVYAGGLGRLRNVPAAIRALPLLDGVHLAVVCVPDTSHAGARALVAVAAEEGVEDRVHLLEPVPPEETVSFLATADIGIHPMLTGVANHEMALPNKLFDYLFAGLPVVVSKVAEMDRFVHRWRVGETFDPDDPADLAAAVRVVLADLSDYATRTCDPALRGDYSWERQAEEIRQLYSATPGWWNDKSVARPGVQMLPSEDV